MDEAVARTVIKPLYRSIPKPSSHREEALRILVLSESNICRSPVAAALLQAELASAGLDSSTIACASKAVRPYAVGEQVPQSVHDVCRASGIPMVAADHEARFWNPEWDVCDYDLILAVDRYVAADAMKEVSVWDTIQKEVAYCTKIRGLYEFGIQGEDIGDPLYGNVGGEEERLALHHTFGRMREAVTALVEQLATALGRRHSRDDDDRSASGGAASAPPLAREEALLGLEKLLAGLGEFEWDAPPMLRKRRSSASPAEERAVASDGLLSLGE